MNQRTKKLLIDMGIALVVAILIAIIMNLLVGSLNIYLALVITPIVWVSLRHGIPTGVVVGAVSGLIIGLITYGFSDFIGILGEILGLALVGTAGSFAKYTQKTLNNRRLSSTYLNIVTGTLLANVLYYLVKFALIPLINNQLGLLSIDNIQFWLSLLINWVLVSAVLIAIAYLKPQWIIPNRSRFLSRKETSTLLND